ncbi:unnamed protein product [Trichogramma brassicae]|uniref:Uncharacterized protein n=1 Tax=Trichogramma brassicae TaxID=86971 RepID=A0A6H5IK53_9HYME|nr:unnamed protein product [Trichogramma brassicae]
MGVRAQAPDYSLELQAVSIISRVAAHPTHVELYGTRVRNTDSQITSQAFTESLTREKKTLKFRNILNINKNCGYNIIDAGQRRIYYHPRTCAYRVSPATCVKYTHQPQHISSSSSSRDSNHYASGSLPLAHSRTRGSRSFRSQSQKDDACCCCTRAIFRPRRRLAFELATRPDAHGKRGEPPELSRLQRRYPGHFAARARTASLLYEAYIAHIWHECKKSCCCVRSRNRALLRRASRAQTLESFCNADPQRLDDDRSNYVDRCETRAIVALIREN